MSVVKGFLPRKFGAFLVDGALELSGGLLGSYFGAMVAALMTVRNPNVAPEIMQSSMRSGFGIGFAFWVLSISFLNRVLIQGISRASIGKKLFHLELVATGEPLTWSRMTFRWLLSIGSITTLGAGYWYALFNKEERSFHDLIAGTDIVPEPLTHSLPHENREPAVASSEVRERMVILNSQAERPMATVIELPHREPHPAEAPAASGAGEDGTDEGKKAA